MRRWMVAPLVFAAAAALSVPASREATAKQPGTPTEEQIITADGVRLKGLFHATAKAKEGDPVVILMYAPGGGRTMQKPGDWEGLATRLNAEGYHVFRFDWRGHGKSDSIVDTVSPANGFWTNPVTGPYNQKYVKGYNRTNPKNTIAEKDINPKYFPLYINDIAAVRMHLDQKNDQGQLNTSSIYLIGSEDAAALGFLWMVAEWNRPGIHPLLGAGQRYEYIPTPGIRVDPEGGKDIAGAVWLSASRPNITGMTRQTLQVWASKLALPLRDNNPMLFLYGERDTASLTNSKFFFDEVLVAGGNKATMLKPIEQTFLRSVPGTNLKGVGLLGQNKDLKTEDTIVAYLAARQKERASLTRKERKYVGPYYVNLAYFGITP